MHSARRAPATGLAAEALEFVRFCYQRRRIGWPELYDEMCAVAGRGLFRGWSADDLEGVGIRLSLFEMPALAALAARVIAEETAGQRSQAQVRGRAGADGASVPGRAGRKERDAAHRGEAFPEDDVLGGILLAPGAA